MSAADELYVYYKLRPERAAAVQQAFQRLCVELARALPGLHSRVLARLDQGVHGNQGNQGNRDVLLLTWMEVHRWPATAAAPPDWTAQLEHLAEPMLALLEGPRHVERFAALGHITD